VTEIIDVRTPGEFAEGHLEGAVNIDCADESFVVEISLLDREETYLLYCRSGARSENAMVYMQGMGFSDVVNLGGYADASAATGIPLVK
jgi:phage shock protein E